MPLKRIAYLGTHCWGNAMHLKKEDMRIYGWFDHYFGNNETIAIELDPSKHFNSIYILDEVEWCDKPNDMYFAKAKLLGVADYETLKNVDSKRNKLLIGMYNKYIRKKLMDSIIMSALPILPIIAGAFFISQKLYLWRNDSIALIFIVDLLLLTIIWLLSFNISCCVKDYKNPAGRNFNA